MLQLFGGLQSSIFCISLFENLHTLQDSLFRLEGSVSRVISPPEFTPIKSGSDFRRTSFGASFLSQEVVGIFFEDLILVQDERWRRALGMQVEREPQGSSGRRVSNAWESTSGWNIAHRKMG